VNHHSFDHDLFGILPDAYFFKTKWLKIISAKPADELPTNWQGELMILLLDGEEDDSGEFQPVEYPQQESTAALAFEWPDINPEDKLIYQKVLPPLPRG
jgi:hypothetical protein